MHSTIYTCAANRKMLNYTKKQDSVLLFLLHLLLVQAVCYLPFFFVCIDWENIDLFEQIKIFSLIIYIYSKMQTM